MISHRRSWNARVVLIGLLVAAILLAAVPAIAQGGVTVRAANNLRLRSEPSTNGAVLTSVPMGTSLTATAISSGGDWVAVTYEGQSGWLALSYLAVEGGSVADLPVSDTIPAPAAEAAPADAAPPAPAPSNLANWTAQTTSVAPLTGTRLRAEPNSRATVLATVPAQMYIPALALSADNQWIQTIYNGQAGWVYRPNVYIGIQNGSLDGMVGVPPMTAEELAMPQPVQVLILVNQARASVGLAPLTLNENLNAAAQRHADDLASHNSVLSHTGSDGSDPYTRIIQAGYPAGWGGENAAQLYTISAREVFWSWMNSQGHRENILRPEFAEMGLAYATGTNETIYYVQTFGRQ